MANPTRLDIPAAAPTRLDPPSPEPTRLDPPNSGPNRDFAPALPSALRERYRILEEFPAGGSEADLLLAAPVAGGESVVVKLYRKGIRPESELLVRLMGASPAHVVQLVEHGESDGRAYEVMEYCAHGSLRGMLANGPLPPREVREIVAELAGAIGEIHAQRILHRDLKPENILVRTLRPLDLVLTDFGISSLQQATQLFTSMARTVKYAAPEALTGVLDAKADWWSMGMIVLEAVAGRHPFAGLSEQVINHHLATRSIDTRIVADESLRKLCRGLLLRDPKRRWGEHEVTRWLARDESLPMPEEVDGAPGSVRPYRLGKAECASVGELAVALAKHWEDGCKDLRRGALGEWLLRELNDRNLARSLQDILELRDVSDDYRLLRFLRVVAPDLPPLWLGKAATPEAIVAAARLALRDDKVAQDWLERMVTEDVLKVLETEASPAIETFRRDWEDAWKRFRELWEVAHHAEEAWLATPKTIGGASASAYVDIDDLMYSRPLRLAQPSRRTVNAKLLLALRDPAYVEAVRGEVLAGSVELGDYCPWFSALGELTRLDPIGVVVARQLLPFAQSDAKDEKKRQGGFSDNRDEHIEIARTAIADSLRRIQEAATPSPVDARIDLERLLGRLHEDCQRLLSLPLGDGQFSRLRSGVEGLEQRAFAFSEAVDRLQAVEDINGIALQPNRILIALAIVAFCFGALGWWAAAIVAIGLILFAVSRLGAYRTAVGGVEQAFRSLMRQGRMLASETPPSNA